MIVQHLHLLERKSFEKLDESDFEKPFPFILFFDSLKMHSRNTIAKNIRGWLNAEWTRLKSGCSTEKPFNPKAMRLFSPEVPCQQNDFDCGVFVCRYAYGVFRIRSLKFSYKDAGMSASSGFNVDLRKMITENEAFIFDMKDINRIRDDMKTIIQRLSAIYQPRQTEKLRLTNSKAEHLGRKKGKPTMVKPYKDSAASFDTVDISIDDPNGQDGKSFICYNDAGSIDGEMAALEISRSAAKESVSSGKTTSMSYDDHEHGVYVASYRKRTSNMTTDSHEREFSDFVVDKLLENSESIEYTMDRPVPSTLDENDTPSWPSRPSTTYRTSTSPCRTVQLDVSEDERTLQSEAQDV